MAYVRDVTEKQKELENLKGLLTDHESLFVSSVCSTHTATISKTPPPQTAAMQQLIRLNQARMKTLFSGAALSTTLVSACLDTVRYGMFYKEKIYDTDEKELHISDILTFTNAAEYFLERASALKIAGEVHSSEKDQATIQNLEEGWAWATQDYRRTRSDMESIRLTRKALSAQNPEGYYGVFWKEKDDPILSFGDHNVKLGDLFANVATETYVQIENNTAYVRMIDDALIPARVGDIPDWQGQRHILNAESRRSSVLIPQMLDLANACYRRAKRFCLM